MIDKILFALVFIGLVLMLVAEPDDEIPEEWVQKKGEVKESE